MAVQTRDPATPTVVPDGNQRLPDDVETSVISGSGVRPSKWAGGPGGSFEQNPEQKPYRFRGLYPKPGAATLLPLQDPVPASGLWRRMTYAQSLDWRVTPPPGPNNSELDWSQHVADDLAGIGDGGFAALIGNIVGSRDQNGFALFERLWEVDPQTLRWHLEDLVYIYPLTVFAWLCDDPGFPIGILQMCERSEDWEPGDFFADKRPIPWAKLAHFGRRDFGRNPEGEAVFRPLIYLSELKSQLFENYAASAKIFGEGWLHATTDAEEGTTEWNTIEGMLEAWDEARRRWILTRTGTTVDAKHGATSLPTLDPVREIDHQQSRGLDDTLQELGTSQFGARAVGSEMRQATHRSLAGEMRSLATELQKKVIYPIYEKNGWDTKRMCSITVRGVTGYEDIAQGRVLLETVRDDRSREPGSRVFTDEQAQKVVRRAMELLDVDLE